MSALGIGVVSFNQVISSKLCPPTVTSAFGFISFIAFIICHYPATSYSVTLLSAVPPSLITPVALPALLI